MISIISLRKVFLLFFLLAAYSPFVASGNDTANSAIRLNTLGFLPDHLKRASIAAPSTDFHVVNDADGSIAFRGKISGPVHNSDTNEELYIADFSALTKPGSYHLDVQGVGRSEPLRIGRDAYDFAFRTMVRAMYLWRCGTGVRAEHDGVIYAHNACHLNDAWLDLAGGAHTQRESTKGWHDAGDYNKYVVNAGVTLGIMFRAWEEFSPQIQKLKLDLPLEDKRLPAYLNEIKWETDWLLTMQAADGSVYHKVSTKEFGPAIMPEDE